MSLTVRFIALDVVRRTDPVDGKSKLYDKKYHTFDFSDRQPVYLDVVRITNGLISSSF